MRPFSLLQRGYICLGLFLVPAPVFLLAGAASGTGPAAVLPLLAALLSTLVILRLKRGFRLPCILLSMALCLFLSLWLGRHSDAVAWVWFSAFLAALTAAIYPRFLSGILDGGSSPIFWYSGLGIIGTVWMAGTLMSLRSAVEMMHRFIWIYSVFMIYALTLESLKEGAGTGRSPSGPMLRKNLAISTVWTALFLLLTHLPAVSQALQNIWRVFTSAVAWLFSQLSRLFPVERGSGGYGGGGGSMSLGEEIQPPSPFWQLMERIFKVACVILIVLALILLLRAAGKAFLRGLRRLAARFRAYMNAVNASYEDHVESLLDWGEIRRGINRRRQQRQRNHAERIRWDQLSPRQQVRRTYQLFLKRHPEIPSSRTARQALQDPRKADIYDAARYSTREIMPEEAASIREIQKT